MKTTTLIITFIFFTIFYCKAQPTEKNEQTGRFTPEELTGYTLSLVTETMTETKNFRDCSFIEGGTVVVNYGIIDKLAGGYASKWQIDDQGRLKINRTPGGYELWTKLSADDDLIEVKISNIGIKPPEPYQRTCIIQQESNSVVSKECLTDRFTTKELSGNSLIWDIHHKYTFKPDGTAIFLWGTKLEEDEGKYRWTVDKEGILKIFKNSDTVYSWRKLSRENDKIRAEITTFYSHHPRREIYRKIKQVDDDSGS